MPKKNAPQGPNAPILYAARGDMPPISLKCDFETSGKVVGWAAPYAYVLACQGDSGEPAVDGRLYRWKPGQPTMELIADGARKPPANLLDEYLSRRLLNSWHGLVFAKLPTGDVGIALNLYNNNIPVGRDIPRGEKYPAFSIGQNSKEVTLLGELDANAKAQPDWAKPFLKKIACGPTELLLEDSKKTFEIGVKQPLGKRSILFSAPRSESFGENFPSNPFHLLQGLNDLSRSESNKPFFRPLAANFPVNFTMGRSVHPFSMGDIHGAVLMQQLMGRSKLTTVFLAFFEPDGIKSIPLQFEPKPDGSMQGKQPKQDFGAEIARPNWVNDNAWGLEGGLLISAVDSHALWFLTKAEVEQARNLSIPNKQ